MFALIKKIATVVSFLFFAALAGCQTPQLAAPDATNWNLAVTGQAPADYNISCFTQGKLKELTLRWAQPVNAGKCPLKASNASLWAAEAEALTVGNGWEGKIFAEKEGHIYVASAKREGEYLTIFAWHKMEAKHYHRH